MTKTKAFIETWPMSRTAFLPWLLLRLIPLVFVAAPLASHGRTIVSLLGPTGSGKTTQGELLSRHRGWPHISPGRILRREIERGTTLGEVCRPYVERGEYVPEELMGALMSREISRVDCNEGCIVDGFPRTLPLWEGLIAERDRDSQIVLVYFDIPAELAAWRCQQRFHCADCGQECLRRGEERACPGCGGPLRQRPVDSSLELLQSRLEMEQKELRPVLAAAQREGWLHIINADDRMETCQAQLREILTQEAWHVATH